MPPRQIRLQFPDSRTSDIHDLKEHPDTGVAIARRVLPQWEETLDIAVRLAQAIGLGYIGVDIVLDQTQGPVVLEANARPGLAIQIANRKGLLTAIREIDYGATRVTFASL